ncbi:MAG: hypothetical protein HOH33_16745 [Verrucomicrobia bacterium]|nr:hypothetical protein [Verrucomicrobiota bacterium]
MNILGGPNCAQAEWMHGTAGRAETPRSYRWVSQVELLSVEVMEKELVDQDWSDCELWGYSWCKESGDLTWTRGVSCGCGAFTRLSTRSLFRFIRGQVGQLTH